MLPPPPPDLACPVPVDHAPVHVELVTAGSLHTTWSQVVDRAHAPAGEVDLPGTVGLLRHETAGLTTVDAGMGLQNRSGAQPGFPLRGLDITVPEGAALVERLDTPPARVLMTHLHYDHVGGLLDLPADTEVWTDTADWQAHMGGRAVGFPPHLYRDTAAWTVVDLHGRASRPVLGRPALDVVGDGSIWYLSLPGHTPGAAAVLVRATDGDWLFVGDTAWVEAHLHDARRPRLVTALVDARPRDLRQSLAWARWLRANCPDLRVVPGHEPRLADGWTPPAADTADRD